MRNAAWRYRDPKGHVAGITSVSLQPITPAPIVPGDTTMTLAYTITARRGGYVVTPDMVQLYDVANPGGGSWGQLETQMALGSAADGSATCAQRAFPSYVSLPTVACAQSGHGNTVTCGSPPPVGPCRVGEARDVLACEILAVAAAEEAYKASHGTYFTGGCASLPDYTPTPDALVTCVATGSSVDVQVSMASPYTPGFYCQYSSAATPSLSCA